MSISSGANRKAGPFNGNGATVAFPFTFKVFAAADLLVVQTDASGVESPQTLTTNYTVSLNANQDSNPGGTVTMNVAPPTNYLITIGSQVPNTQPMVLTNGGNYYPTVQNDAADRAVILIQQLAEKVLRAFTLPFSAPAGVSAQVPLPAANMAVKWNATATGLVNSTYDPDATGTAAAAAATSATNAANSATSASGSATSASNSASAAAASAASAAANVPVAIHSATSKTTPVGADELGLWDSVTGLLNKISFTNLWANLSSLYMAIVAPGTSGNVLTSNGAAWISQAPASNAPIQGAIKGLNAYSTGLDAHYYASIDEVALKDGSNNYITRRNVFYDVNTAAAAGANALDTGTVAANSWYSVWAIYNPTTLTDAAVGVLVPTLTGNTTSGSAVVTALSSTASMRVGMPTRSANFPAGTVIKTVDSGTQVTMSKPSSATTTGVNIEFVYDPVMPSGYTSKARIDRFRTDGTANKFPLSFIRDEGGWQYVVKAGSNVTAMPQIGSGVAGSITVPTWAAIGLTSFICPLATKIILSANSAEVGTGAVIAAPNNAYGAYNSTTNPPVLSARNYGIAQCEMLVESANIYWASDSANKGLFCLGFK